VLVKGRNARFEQVPADGKYAIAGVISSAPPVAREIVLMSAHADAFKAARRRVFTGEVVDWARNRPSGNR